MKKTLLITGGNKGLGKALIDIALKDANILVISISRSLHKDHINLNENKLLLLPIDLSTLKNIENKLKLKQYYNSDEIIFINNAATISPIGKVGGFKEKEILNNIHVNMVVPVLITNHILNNLTNQRVKIVNVSSGASKKSISGWSLYCSVKAANEMFFNTLKFEEEKNKKIEIYNAFPGVMDTEMQQTIRSIDSNAMPEVDKFREFHKKQQLKTAKDVAFSFNELYNLFTF